MRSPLPFALLALLGCTPTQIAIQQPPQDALRTAEARLTERAIPLDPVGRRPDRLRSAWFCYQPPGLEDRRWERTFANVSSGPVPFEVQGPMTAQDEALRRCPQVVRFSVLAQGAALTVETEWYRVTEGRCEPVGERLLSEHRCQYDYRGALPGDDLERPIYQLLSGL